MRAFVLRHGILIGIALIFIGSAGTFLWRVITHDPLASLTLTTVDTGAVEQLVTVSGATESRYTAALAFPVTGLVAAIPVTEGDRVEAGTLLATLASTQQLAALDRARAEVVLAEAALATTEAGSRSEVRAVSAATVESAAAEVRRIEAAGTLAVDNARRALYSTGLTARTTKAGEEASAPIITGTYRCGATGTYTLRVYNSSAASGYSMQISGLETGTYPVSTDQPITFGTCGLFAQFSPDHTYHNTTWTITIPNDASSQYITLRNALAAAEQSAVDSLAAAKDALRLAEREASVTNAEPRSEDVRAAKARLTQAKAALTAETAALADRSIIAPFTGTISQVAIRPGETAPLTPVITLIATDAYEVVARVPEIDITKIATGQTARLRFDAAANSPQTGTVSYIAPLPTLIDGVAYFEVKITLTETPSWLRGGLNADIDIVTAAAFDTARLPTRFITRTDTGNMVTTLTNGNLATTSLNITFLGTDGYAAIDTLIPGTTVVAP